MLSYDKTTKAGPGDVAAQRADEPEKQSPPTLADAAGAVQKPVDHRSPDPLAQAMYPDTVDGRKRDTSYAKSVEPQRAWYGASTPQEQVQKWKKEEAQS